MPAARPDFAARVAAFIRQNALWESGERAAVALSGGPDSVALLLALVRGAERGHFAPPAGVLHFHHGIRGRDANEDAAFCAGLAARLGLPCVIGLGAVPQKNGVYSNAEARRARYDFLTESARDVNANVLATAHTKNDQAETVLWRVLRGTGLSGLSGIAPRRVLPPGVSLVRPLLGVSRADVEAFCQSEGVVPRRDPTNENRQFTRVRMRGVLPDLARNFNPRLWDALPRLAAHAARDADLLDSLAQNLWNEAFLPPLATGEEDVALAVPPLIAAHPALRTRVLLRALRRAAQNLPEADEAATDYFVQKLDDLLLNEGRANKKTAADLPGKIRAACDNQTLRLSPAQAAQNLTKTASPAPYALPLRVGESAALPPLSLRISARWRTPSDAPITARRSSVVDCACPALSETKNANGTMQPSTAPPLLVRNARKGDRIAPLGMKGKTRLVRDILAEANVPANERDAFPLVVRGDTGAVWWIVGVLQAEETRIIDQTDQIDQTGRIVRLCCEPA